MTTEYYIKENISFNKRNCKQKIILMITQSLNSLIYICLVIILISKHGIKIQLLQSNAKILL